jgi:cell wall-associated NlpC family hydrolase
VIAMQQLVVSYLLEAGGRDVGRWLGGLAVLGVMLLLLVVSAPVIVVAALTGPAIPTGAAAAHQAAPAAVAVQPASGPASSSAVDVARRYLGVPYVFGGSNPAIGLDCSGLVQLVFRQLGVALPRTAQTQFAATVRVTQEQLQPGDLVFFSRTYIDPHDWITHVGIYVGNGLQINAPTEGQVVSIQPVFSGFWGAHFAGVGRVGRA